MYELAYYRPSECWFLTLTYDDDNIMDVGSDIFSGTLLKNDLSAFMKRLRRYSEYHDISESIRFYACGEYGDHTHRPHYHMIIFGLDLTEHDQLKYWLKTKSGHNTWRSPLLEKVWSKGYVVVAPVTWDTCAYTARYVLKKANGLCPDDYVHAGVEPEFVLMSRRPGIGSRYFDDHYSEIYENDEIFIKGPDGGRKAKPPKFYDKKYEKINPEHLKEIKDNRRSISERIRQMKLERTGLSISDILEIEEEALKSRIKLLKRI